MIRFARLDPEGKDNVTVMKKDKTIAECQDNMFETLKIYF